MQATVTYRVSDPAVASTRIDFGTDRLVCFGDGIEADALTLSWGQRLSVRRAQQKLRLVR